MSDALDLARWDSDVARGLSPGAIALKQAAEYDAESRAWRERMGIKERVREKKTPVAPAPAKEVQQEIFS